MLIEIDFYFSLVNNGLGLRSFGDEVRHKRPREEGNNNFYWFYW
jgi:hypothetical protein